MLIFSSSNSNAWDQKIVDLNNVVLPVSNFQLPRLKADYVLRIFEAIPSRHCRDTLEGLIIRTMGAVPFTLHPKSLTRSLSTDDRV